DGIRKVHDFLTVGAPTPLQHAGIAALELPDSYYERIALEYGERRDLMMQVLATAGFEASPPRGAYYVMADVGHLPFGSDVEVADHMVEHVGVAVVPGSSFFSVPDRGRHVVRFAFCKRLPTLRAAAERLRRLS
ncbi:MAG: aminotransferase class I/II-fold pyridoxal phosphate-dependent enzyme, partial [Actinomycetota bacterium]